MSFLQIFTGSNRGAPVSETNPIPIKQGAGSTYRLAGTVAANGTVTPQASLAAAAGTTAVSQVRGGSYVFDAQFGGTTPSLQLQSLASDGVTWRNVGAALTAPGGFGVVIGEGSSVRLLNAGANEITGLSATLT